MKDYGVETPAWRALPWSWAAERLAGNRNFWLVTVSASGAPHALPVWGVWEESELRFAFSCSPNARKARNLSDNPRCVVMTEDTVECLSIEGHAAPVATARRRDEWIARYLNKYGPMAPELSADFVRAHLLLGFEPHRAFGVIERNEEFATRATRWIFDRPEASQSRSGVVSEEAGQPVDRGANAPPRHS